MAITFKIIFHDLCWCCWCIDRWKGAFIERSEQEGEMMMVLHNKKGRFPFQVQQYHNAGISIVWVCEGPKAALMLLVKKMMIMARQGGTTACCRTKSPLEHTFSASLSPRFYAKAKMWPDQASTHSSEKRSLSSFEKPDYFYRNRNM